MALRIDEEHDFALIIWDGPAHMTEPEKGAALSSGQRRQIAIAAFGDTPPGQQANLYRALNTLADMVTAFTCQPRFNCGGSSGSLNAAGRVLDDLLESLCAQADALADLMLATEPKDRLQVDERARALLLHSVQHDDRLSEVPAKAAAFAVRERH